MLGAGNRVEDLADLLKVTLFRLNRLGGVDEFRPRVSVVARSLGRLIGVMQIGDEPDANLANLVLGGMEPGRGSR